MHSLISKEVIAVNCNLCPLLGKSLLDEDMVVKGGTLGAITPAAAGRGEVYQDINPPSTAQPAEPCVPAQGEV